MARLTREGRIRAVARRHRDCPGRTAACRPSIAHRIGTHAIFGAFLFGAVMPHDSALARALEAKLHDLVTILLLPAFFAFTGMRTQIGLLASAYDWAVCGLIILVATAGKFGGTFAGAG